VDGRFQLAKYHRYFAVYEGNELVCVCLYKKGALAVIRRLTPKANSDMEGELAMLTIYVDGACKGNNSAIDCPSGWGLVIEENGKRVTRAYGHSPSSTNNQMEMTAILEGLKRVPDESSVHIISDSRFALGAIAGLTGARGYRLKAEKVKAIQTEIIRLAGDKGLTVSAGYVPGHSGHPGNEMANNLAEMAAVHQVSSR
jgi:ribonuclease HI/DNA polymerase-3 subunit epsilon